MSSAFMFPQSSEASSFTMLGQRPIAIWNEDIDTTNYNPLRTWVLQLVLIMTLTQILFQVLKRFRQPRVIAEILAGILLSPSALGRISGFTNYFFPERSQPYLFLIADVGLILFLFLIGLEIDGSGVRKTASLSASIALGGILLPFAFGSALSVPLYNHFANPDVEFTHFLLFISIAFSITAFPVLCRILTELKLLDTTVGIVVLSVGVLNDIFGWILLALSLTLARSTSSLSALWILLYGIAWVLLILFPVKRVILWLAHRTGSVNNGPSILFMTITIMTMFCSAFFTDLIGIHAIFGAFLVGTIVPRKGGLAIALTEKLEDMVSIIFLPLYFTASGLSTDFGLLKDETTLAFTLVIIIFAWIGKFGGGSLAAYTSGFRWREAASIGTLLSCKGLIELIVLNVGLSAGIINKTVFSMFVLEALMLTFLTTPVVMTVYPPKHRQKTLHNTPVVTEDAERDPVASCAIGIRRKSLITVVLDKMDALPSVMHFMDLVNDRIIPDEPDSPGSSDPALRPPSSSMRPTRLSIQALRLIELSERSSDVMKSSASEHLLLTDPLLNIFKSYCSISEFDISASLSIIPLEGFASKIAESTNGHSSELVLIPCWGPQLCHSDDNLHKPLSDTCNTDYFSVISGPYLSFLRDFLTRCITDSIILFERGTESIDHRNGRHFIFPFFGGIHDRTALRLIFQLCLKKGSTATVLHIPYQSRGINRETTDASDGANNELNRVQPDSYSELNPEQKVDDDLWREFTDKSNMCKEMQDVNQRIEFPEKEKTHSLTNAFLRLHFEVRKTLTERSKRPCIILGHENERRARSPDRCTESFKGVCCDTLIDVPPDVIMTLGILPSLTLANIDYRTSLMIVRSGHIA